MPTDVTSTVVETLVGSGPTAVSSAIAESLTGGDPTAVSSVTVETLVANDLASTHVSGVIIETLVAENPGHMDVHGVVIETLVGSLRPSLGTLQSTGYQGIAERRWGRDLVVALPNSGVPGVVPPTISGDWPTVAGRPNLHAAHRRRAITTPGQLVHQPEYGGGLETFVGTLNNPSQRARVAQSVRRNALRDPRVEDAQVGASDLGNGRVQVDVSIRPSGEIEAEQIQILADEG